MNDTADAILQGTLPLTENCSPNRPRSSSRLPAGGTCSADTRGPTRRGPSRCPEALTACLWETRQTPTLRREQGRGASAIGTAGNPVLFVQQVEHLPHKRPLTPFPHVRCWDYWVSCHMWGPLCHRSETERTLVVTLLPN